MLNSGWNLKISSIYAFLHLHFIQVKVKVQSFPRLTVHHAMKECGGLAPHIFKLTSEWSASCLCSFTIQEIAPGSHWIGGWLGPRADLDTWAEINALATVGNLILITQLSSTYSCKEFLWCGGQYSHSLRAVRSGDWIPLGVRFSAPVQTGPGAHPAPSTMVTGSFPGVKWPGRGVDLPPPSSAQVEGRVDLYICSPSGVFVACSRMNFTCNLFLVMRLEYVIVTLHFTCRGRIGDSTEGHVCPVRSNCRESDGADSGRYK